MPERRRPLKFNSMERSAFRSTNEPRPDPSLQGHGTPQPTPKDSQGLRRAGAPKPFADPENALESLAGRCRRLADAIEATTRRRDVRERRAKLVLSILALRCPTQSLPRVDWYVPGAVARVGAEGLWRLWKEHWGEPAPSLRTIRAHLGELEMACVIARSPGDWLPVMRNPEHPERRPRYPDTFHVLESHDAAHWWSTTGRARIEASPDCRFSPTRWRQLFGQWRQEAAQEAIQGQLYVIQEDKPLQRDKPIEHPVAQAQKPKRPRGIPRAARKPTPAALERARVLGLVALDENASALQIHSALKQAGVQLEGRMGLIVGVHPEKLRGAMAMLGVALARGDAIRKPAGWLVRAFRHGTFGEMEAALDRLEGMDPAQ